MQGTWVDHSGNKGGHDMGTALQRELSEWRLWWMRGVVVLAAVLSLVLTLILTLLDLLVRLLTRMARLRSRDIGRVDRVDRGSSPVSVPSA